MYGGYAWLTNAAPPVTPRRRLLLLVGMIGLFVTAMAIPHAYGSDRVVFACGYLVVVVVHAGMYVSEAARLTRGMVVQLLGWNMAGAVLGLVGALFFEDILVWWWLASFVVAVGLPRLFSVTALNQVEDDGGPSFTLVPGHFVERHGLMLLIALGESVLAIGVGLGTGLEAIGLEQIAFAAISLLLAATLYWAYFGVGEDARAEAALDVFQPNEPRLPGSRHTATRSGSSSSASCSAPRGCTTPWCTRRTRSAGDTPPSCAWALACSGSDSDCFGSRLACPVRYRVWRAGCCLAPSP